jgi:hypothetical protein
MAVENLEYGAVSQACCNSLLLRMQLRRSGEAAFQDVFLELPIAVGARSGIHCGDTRLSVCAAGQPLISSKANEDKIGIPEVAEESQISPRIAIDDECTAGPDAEAE